MRDPVADLARSGRAPQARRAGGSFFAPRRGFRANSRGQVLVIAVLIMFAVGALAALFAAIVGSQVVQVSRYADVAELRQAAESALRYANEQLTYSRNGADWRPAAGAPPYRAGKALVYLNVQYMPDPSRLTSRFLGIAATAKFPDNPFVQYSVLAYKSLLLTDYARFITDRFELRQPAALGAAGVELQGNLRTTSLNVTPYQFSVWGPIRSNTDLLWYGNSRVGLTVTSSTSTSLLRDDRIEVSGYMKPAPASTDPTTLLVNNPQPSDAALQGSPLQLFVNRTDLNEPWQPSMEYTPQSHNLFAPASTAEQWGYRNGYSDMEATLTGFNALPNGWRVLAELPNYTPQLGSQLTPASYAVPRIEPPSMDAVHPELHTNRYLILTRDSGAWTTLSNKQLTNSGTYGWGWADGGGIYIDNTADVQYNHDLEKLRQNWMGGYYQNEGGDARPHRAGGNAPADWWDKTGRYYLPPGAEIILHGEATCPFIEIRRDDVRREQDPATGTWADCYWQDQNGVPIPTGGTVGYTPKAGQCNRTAPNSIVTSVFRNVAYFPFPPDGVIFAEGNVRVRGIMPMAYGKPGYQYMPSHGNRRFDLQIVSGGTIYVEGDILTATRAGYDTTGLGDSYAARVALIARDNVCLNTTALLPRPANLFQVADGNYYNDGQPTYLSAAQTRDKNGTLNPGYPQYLWFRGREGQDPSTWDETAPLPTDPEYMEFLYQNAWLLNSDRTKWPPAALNLRLMVGHAAWYIPSLTGTMHAEAPSGDAQPAKVLADLSFTNANFPAGQVPDVSQTPWTNSQGHTYTFLGTGTGSAAAAESGKWYLDPVVDNPALPNSNVNNFLEWLPTADQPMTFSHVTGATADASQIWLNGLDDRLTITPSVMPVLDKTNPVRTWKVAPEQLGYVLGPLAVAPARNVAPMPVEIHALIYAQNGSWFVLPGPWFNEDPDEVYSFDSLATHPYPAYHEPLNLQIKVCGAITENMPAPIGDVTDWTSKWCGPYVSGGGFLSYEYDPMLHSYRSERDGKPAPIFPYLPMTPDLLVWGERVSGTGTAGT